uniref:Gonadotropin subunit beta-2 n=1 Tax=Periophthalmus magnuspinnatus TaxID=409849 RepID=A0A3B4B0Z3_9GOBI
MTRYGRSCRNELLLTLFIWRQITFSLPMCVPSDFTLFVEEPECNFCVAINTTICMGYCRTKVFGPLLNQKSCTYEKVEYHTARLPGCADNAVFTYPVALSCHCGVCRTENHECRYMVSQPGDDCMTPRGPKNKLLCKETSRQQGIPVTHFAYKIRGVSQNLT